MLRRIAAVAALVAISACKKDAPASPAGTKVLTWARGGFGGNTVTDVGPDAVEVKNLLVPFSGAEPIRIALTVTHGQANVVYKDGTSAPRAIPRRLSAELTMATSLAVSVACSADLSGPTEPKPKALFTSCSVSAPQHHAVFDVFGDGDVVAADTETKILVSAK